MDKKIGFRKGLLNGRWVPIYLLKRESTRDQRSKLMEKDFCSLGIPVDEGQGLASGMSKVSGDGLPDSAAAED